MTDSLALELTPPLALPGPLYRYDGPRADRPLIIGPGKIGPKWADGPSRALEKPGRAKTGRATARHKPSSKIKLINLKICFYFKIYNFYPIIMKLSQNKLLLIVLS